MDTKTRTVRKKLIEVAKRKGLISYKDVGRHFDLHQQSRALFQILDDINRHEHAAGRPLLTAIVVHKDDSRPGNGFFAIATKLGHYRGGDAELYWLEECRRVYAEWASA